MNRLCALLLMVMYMMTFMMVVNGKCTHTHPHFTLIDSKEEITCEHDHIDYMVGSVVRTTACEECTCAITGMTCCGYGPKADDIHVPDGYKIEDYGCEYQIVKA